jgi:uncharacterized protein YndB with AHSA1/START domain/DNA-binding transcriptional ArsR family regulator
MAAYSESQDVFKALADPGRRRLLDSLNARNGQTLRELCAEMDMARQSVSKHLAVLEAANLVSTVWRGREKLHYLNPAPINDISERWIHRYDQRRVDALADLKQALETPTMQKQALETPTMQKQALETPTTQKPSFVYTTYIQTTPERLWQALTEPAFTERYWNLVFETDWQPGSNMTWIQRGVRGADPDQVVLESDPYRRLSYSWHTFTPELARAVGVSEELFATAATEPRSKITFDLEPTGDAVKLTVVHDGFEPGSVVAELVSGGWPQVIARMKTLLETGDTFEIRRPIARPDAELVGR